jgi:diguanylate cyclase (GGDEF)-like protein/PAS domain S-box-containing protein
VGLTRSVTIPHNCHVREGPPGGVTTVAADFSARGAVDDALVQAATAAEVGLVRISPDGGVWWSDEAYRLHGRPRWRRVRLLDDVVEGVPADAVIALLETYAAALTDPDIDLRYSVTGANGEHRDLVIRAIGPGVAVVHRAASRRVGTDHVGAHPLVTPHLVAQPVSAQPISDEAAIVDVREGRPEPEPLVEMSVDDGRALLEGETTADVAPADVEAPDVEPADDAPEDDAPTVDALESVADVDLAAAVLSATPDLVLLYDVVEHRYLSMAGHDDEARELVDRLSRGGGLRDDIHPDDYATLVAWRDELHTLEPGGVRHLDVRMRHDGDWRWSEIRASEFRRGADGDLTQAVVIVRDVHARVSAGRRIADSERAFRELFDASPVGLAVLDDQSRFTDVNDAFCLLVGHTRDAVLATVFEALLHPQDRAAAVISRARRVADGLPSAAAERRLNRADGSTIWVRMRTSDLDYADHQRTLVSVEDVTSAKDTETQLRHDALHDELTGLPNRRLITDRLELALTRGRRGGGRVALFFIDLDDLKRVNDTHPWQHRAGDILLETVAIRVRETLREADTLGRLGGDEFVAICEDVGDDDSLGDIGDRILAAVCRPLTIGAETIAVGVSIGVAVTDDEEEDAEHLLRRADAAMYAAKAAGGARVARAGGGDLGLPAHLDLVGALARRELRLHYQPVVSLGTGAVLGVVGAVRWDHPDRGLIPAHELRSALGAGATTLPIVHWCIDRAITDVRTVAPVRAEHVSVWLSMPGRAALAASTRDAIVSAIAGPDGTLTTDSAPSLVLDVHEVDVASLTRRQALHRHLDDLLEVGPLALGVEHFTADMVPVGMLQLLSAASVSLDPDLLASVGENRSTEELVRALVAAASALGVITVAMHVDSPEQLAIARSLGIHAAYGDLVGPAAPLDTYADLLQVGRMELPGAAIDTAADPGDEVVAADAGLGDNVPTDLALSPGPDEGPSDADIWAGVLGRRRHELVSDGTTTGPEPVLPPEQATTPGAEPVVLPPSPSLWPTVEAAVEPVVAAQDASEPQQDNPVSTVSVEPVVVDLRDLVVHAPAPQEPERPLTTTPAPTTAADSIGDAVARELGFDLPPAPSPPPPLIGEIVARELGVELAPDRAPTSGSIAEQVAYDMGLRLPTVTPPVAVVEPAAGYWEHELDTDY